MSNFVTIKKCGKCKNNLNTTLFSKSSKSKDGFQGWCKNCNTGIGLLKENISFLKKSIAYLEKYVKNQEVIDV